MIENTDFFYLMLLNKTMLIFLSKKFMLSLSTQMFKISSKILLYIFLEAVTEGAES